MAIEKRIRKNGISFKIIAYAGYYIDDNGKRKQKRMSKTFHPPENMSEQKAYKKALLIEEHLQNHINMVRYVPSELTINYLWEMYLNNYMKLNQKITTQVTTINIVEVHILPYFKDMKLSQINPLVIQKFLIHCSKKKRGNHTLTISYLKTIKIKLHSILQYAVELEWIDKNPCSKCKIKSEKYPKEKYIFSIQSIKEIYSYLKDENIYDDIIKFQLLTGLRIGETLAITINDINFSENYIDINKSVSRANNEFIVGTPKSNNSYRRIYINKLLKKIINHNLKSDLLFSINDSYIHYANVRSRLKTILKNTPYHNLTIHDLRHIHSSLLLYNKVDLKSISTHLGHSSIRITSDIYLHTAHEASEQLSINIENIFNDLKK